MKSDVVPVVDHFSRIFSHMLTRYSFLFKLFHVVLFNQSDYLKEKFESFLRSKSWDEIFMYNNARILGTISCILLIKPTTKNIIRQRKLVDLKGIQCQTFVLYICNISGDL